MATTNEDERMTILLVGFDSAWTPTNSGALVGVLQLGDGAFRELGPPQIVNYPEAEEVIAKWKIDLAPTATIVLLDQPTIVKNAQGQRPVENLVGSPVSLRYGGMQPANTAPQVQPAEKEDLLEFGLATRLQSGVAGVWRARTLGNCFLDRQRCSTRCTEQERSGRAGCMSLSPGRAALGRKG